MTEQDGAVATNGAAPHATDAPPRSYAERWQAMSREDKERLTAGGLPADEQADLLSRLDQLALHTPAERAALLAYSRRRLRRTVSRLRNTEDRVRQLRFERDVLFIEQALLGVQQIRIAEAGQVTAMIVAGAIGTSDKRR